MYEQPEKLGPDNAHRRIYAPCAYPAVREAWLVPIIQEEAFGLAAWYPVVWQKADNTAHLVTLRSLFKDGRGFAPGAHQRLETLPLLLRAYPFLMAADAKKSEIASDRERLRIDEANPDEPTDAGAPVMTAQNRLSKGAEQRLRALAVYEKGRSLTAEMSAFLMAHDLFENWPLTLTAQDEQIDIQDLVIVRQETFGTGALAGFIERFGIDGMQVLTAHRLSLFRAGFVIKAAQMLKTEQVAGAAL